MDTITANEAKLRFRETIDKMHRGPVRVTRRNCVVGVMVSAEDCAAMRDFYASRLVRTASSALDADLLDGQQGSWYADVVARLGDPRLTRSNTPPPACLPG